MELVEHRQEIYMHKMFHPNVSYKNDYLGDLHTDEKISKWFLKK